MANLQGIFSVLPAHAGVILTVAVSLFVESGPTRTRGGDPTDPTSSISLPQSYPDTRG